MQHAETLKGSVTSQRLSWAPSFQMLTVGVHKEYVENKFLNKAIFICKLTLLSTFKQSNVEDDKVN
jgi:hypothetical protein